VSVLKAILGASFLLLPTIGTVIGIILGFRRQQQASRLRLVATIFSLVAVVVDNIYFLVVALFLPIGAGPVHDAMYQHRERLEVFGVRLALAILPVALVGTGIARGIAILGTIFLLFLWIEIGIRPWG